MITAESPVKFDRKKQKDETLLSLYKNILTPAYDRRKNVASIAPRSYCQMV